MGIFLCAGARKEIKALYKKGERMKRRIFKQQPIKKKYNTDYRKIIYRNTRHRAGKAAMMLALCLLMGNILPVHGQEVKVPEAKTAEKEASVSETPRVVVTEIYHRHIGNASEKGGCYQTEIPHIHKGDEINGGACFGQEVKHMHQGDADLGTGCYTKPVLHTHQGNEGQEGACYKAVYHTHEDSCYKNEICTINYTIGDFLEKLTGNCITHGEVIFDRHSGTGTHQDCPVGEEALLFDLCPYCEEMLYSYHTYPVVICGIDTDLPTGYEKICGMEEGDIEGYDTECGLAEGQTEAYKRTCEKLVDGYERNCGLDEENPCGRLTVTNETDGEQEKVIVSVKFEDLSGGKLVPDKIPFVWYDENGNHIGNGDQIEVEKNGNYSVELKLQNRDVDESGLKSEILVDNVLEKIPDGGQETPSPSATPSSEKGGEASPTPEQTPSGGGSGEDDQDGGEDTPASIPSAAPAPAHVLDGENSEGEGTGGDSLDYGKPVKAFEDEDGAGLEKSESPTPKITLKKETTEKKAEEKMESAPAMPEVKKVSKIKGFFSHPAVRIVTVAAGTLLLLAGLVLLLLYLRKSVRLYNDDGEGRWGRLGRLVVRLEEEGYAVTISEKEEEKAYTNRYCIKPGLFRLGKGEQEIFVYKDTQRISVSLAKEMVVVL